MDDVAEGNLQEKEKAQAGELAPKFTSVFRIANAESNYDMLFRFILSVESATWRELGVPGGLTRFWAKAVFGHSSANLPAGPATSHCD
jgi:hypothetical protein